MPPQPVGTFPPCPACGSAELVEIVYGLPDADLFRAAARGEGRLGGCIVEPEAPDYECGDCHAALPWVAQGGNERIRLPHDEPRVDNARV